MQAEVADPEAVAKALKAEEYDSFEDILELSTNEPEELKSLLKLCGMKHKSAIMMKLVSHCHMLEQHITST